MSQPNISTTHMFLGATQARNERRTWAVAALTTLTMLAEIVGGWWFGSLAVLADGLHMATHAGVMLIAALAYWLARRYAADPRFVFGTAKLGDLAGLLSAVLLGLVALEILYESIARLIHPRPIVFGEAIMLAGLAVVVNILSVVLLRHPHGHGHHHDHAHASHHHHDHSHDDGDNNMRAAYVHMLGDLWVAAMALAALLLARRYGWLWLDPAAGLLGSLVILNWSVVLIKSAGQVLLDICPSPNLAQEIQTALTADGTSLADFHLWRVGPGHYGLVASVIPATPASLADYKERLLPFSVLSHTTIEIQASIQPA